MTPWFLDTECYIDYFLLMFMREDGRTKSFELYDGHPLDVDGINRSLHIDGAEYVSFNGINYDNPMIALALSGADNAALKRASDDIILNGKKPWDFERDYGVTLPEYNHIDLIELAPGMVSLKIYIARLHGLELQDLPFEPGDSIAPSQRPVLRTYCHKDLKGTQLLRNALKENIDIRRIISSDIKWDVRSKSDAQIAEAVLRHAYVKMHGKAPRKLPLGYKSFNYVPPTHIRFRAPQLNAALETLRTEVFNIADSGHVDMPESISDMVITIGNSRYKMGIGGLHSQESEVTHYANDDTMLKDIDVESYYPKMIVNTGMYPDALGPMFLDKYDELRVERIEAKHKGDKTRSDVLKIVLNGTFGKTASIYSIFYNPKMMLTTTVTGQLNLLMLIEALEHFGIPVVSANTDGIVVKCPRVSIDKLRKIVQHWEKVANLNTEWADYKSIHFRDVNNYIAFKTDGSVKCKGTFAKSGLAKSPANEICTEAVIKYLRDSVPVETTIRSCTDIRKFLTVRSVTGGAHKDGYVLGKAIRWYYAVGETGVITYKSNGNTVGRSEGAKPLMDLPETFPSDVNYDWYIKESNDLLMDIGVVPRPPVVKLPRKNSKAWKQMVADGLISVA